MIGTVFPFHNTLISSEYRITRVEAQRITYIIEKPNTTPSVKEWHTPH